MGTGEIRRLKDMKPDDPAILSQKPISKDFKRLSSSDAKPQNPEIRTNKGNK